MSRASSVKAVAVFGLALLAVAAYLIVAAVLLMGRDCTPPAGMRSMSFSASTRFFPPSTECDYKLDDDSELVIRDYFDGAEWLMLLGGVAVGGIPLFAYLTLNPRRSNDVGRRQGPAPGLDR